MEKIIVITGHSGADERFIECLQGLFPDCEIQTLKREPGGSYDARVIPLVPEINARPLNAQTVRRENE